MSKLLPVLVVSLASSVAQAQIDLVATGTLDPKIGDLSTATAGLLENGVPGNRQGGLGSAFAYAGGNTFIGLPDRGPNAKAYDPAVDDTTNYIPRFQTLQINLSPSETGSALPFVLSAHMLRTTLLYKAGSQTLAYGAGGPPILNNATHSYFTGRSDAFDAGKVSTTRAVHGRLDPEGIRVSNDGQSVFLSDEYGPQVYRFNRCTGLLTGSYQMPYRSPSVFGISVQSGVGATEISSNTIGRVTNKGMEGLAISPDGTTLFGAMQSPLLQDGGTNASVTRIVKIDVATSRVVGQFAYRLTNIGTVAKPKYPTVSEIVAINNNELLVDERDGKGLGDDSQAAFKRLYHIDLSGAADVSAISSEASLIPKAVSKTLFLDVVAALVANGITSENIPAKIEGVAFGPDISVNGVTKHTLFLATDNDFLPTLTGTLHPAGVDNPTQFFAFSVDTADLPGFVPQQFAATQPICR